ncbi:serine/threonine-protein phosphatase 6 regulatory ankyrin repeat subunit B-like [Watersipora subatra]|uniref:serine/threonine-protein phosphatase 6 regulatory ankyrin repeat subunit B-like n=1 Tax=Watersipora subatra TaxID=2589382 RepID=UPI00355C6E6B
MANSSPLTNWLTNYIEDADSDLGSLQVSLEGKPVRIILKSILEVRDKDNYTAVRLAVLRDHPEVLGLLLGGMRGEADKLLFEMVEGVTALYRAAQQGYTACINILIASVSPQRRLQLVLERDGGGWTAVTWAAVYGKTESVKALLHPFLPEQRHDILKTQSNILRTAIHNAACCGHTETLESLVDCLPANKLVTLLSMKDAIKHTPLELAESMKHHSAAELLRRKERAATQETILESYKQIDALKEENHQQAKALEEAHHKIIEVHEQSRQWAEVLMNRQDNMQKMLDQLQIYLRRAEPTDVDGDQEIEDYL